MDAIQLKIFSIIVILLMLAASPFASQAVEINNYQNMPVEGDIVLSPSKVELFLNPEESADKNLHVTNRTGRDLNFKITIEDFTGDEEFFTKLLGEEEGTRSLKQYLKITDREFSLAHGEKADLPVTVALPDKIDPGGLYSAVIVSASPKEQLSGNKETANNLSFISRLACLFFVRAKGEVNEEGFLKLFTSEKKVYQQTPINFKLVYQNKGSVHLNPYGSIEIKNIFGQAVDKIAIDPFFVMPGFSRKRTLEWKKEIAFGRYTADLTLNKGYQDFTDKLKLNFWIIPLNTILTIIFVLIILLVAFWRFFKRFEIKKRE